MMPTLPSRAILCALVAAVAFLPACRASTEKPKPKPVAAAPAPPAAPAPAVDDSMQVAPVIAPVARYGLEITWWIADDSITPLSTTLHAIALPDQRIDTVTLERLRQQGIRPVRIAEASLLELTNAAVPTAGIERLWIGLAPDWTPTRFPAPLDAGVVRAIPGLGAPVQVGMLRFLWRSYLAAEDLSPILRMDLSGQAISADYARTRMSERSASAGGEARLPRPVDAGPMIESLTSTLVFHPGEVIVLIADNPDADWDRGPDLLPDLADPYAPPPPPPAPHPDAPVQAEPALIDAEDHPRAAASADAPGAEPGATPPSAPQLPPRETFGELVLSPELPTKPGTPGKLIIALIPHIPERLELIPKPRAVPRR